MWSYWEKHIKVNNNKIINLKLINLFFSPENIFDTKSQNYISNLKLLLD